MRKESEIQKAILDYLHLQRVVAWRSNQIPAPSPDGKFRRFAGRRGVADVIGIMPDGSGRLLAIEVKSEKGRISPEQAEFGKDVLKAKGVYIVARSLDDVIQALKEADCRG